MFTKPNDGFASNKRFAAADFLRHWKPLFSRLLWFILMTALFGYTLYLPFEQTEPYLTQEPYLLSRILRLEMKEGMKNGDTRQRSGDDDERIEEKAETIRKVSQNLLTRLNTPWYFVCVAHGGKLLRTASGVPDRSPSADDLCDKNLIENYVHVSGNLQKKHHIVPGHKSGNLDIFPTLHFVNDEDGSGFHLWVVKRLQPEQADPAYSLVRDDPVRVVLILGTMVLLTYALGRFVRRKSRSKSDSGGKGVV